MEFNSGKKSFFNALTVLDTVAEQLADVDLTLPDYCPDIEKILKCTLTPKIQSKSLSGGQLQIDGICVVNVLYVESIKKSIRCCEQTVNFSQSFSVKETTENPVIITKTKSEYINCRALSPRRLVMHGAFSLYAKVLCSLGVKLFSPDLSQNLETNLLSTKCASLSSLCQEQFGISEEISMNEKPAIESILTTSVNVNVSETKAVTGKLMVNGEINLKMLYLTSVDTGETAKIDYLLPFNQIIDCEGVDENTINCVTSEVMSYDVRLKNDVMSEKPSVLLDIKVCLTEQGYVVNDEQIVTDVYSVDYATKVDFEQLPVSLDVNQISDTFIEKSSIKIDNDKINKIIDIYSDNISIENTFDENGITANGKINICILAINENNIPCFIERSIDYSHILASSTDCNNIYSICPKVISISYRLADDNSIELRCEIRIKACVSKKININAVNNAEVCQDKPLEKEKYALTLYFAKSGEKMWDIAKSHNTRLDLLIEENSLEKPVVDYPCMLLVPRV